VQFLFAFVLKPDGLLLSVCETESKQRIQEKTMLPRFWPTRTSPFFRPSAHGVRQVVKARFSVSTTWRTFLFIRFFFITLERFSPLLVFSPKGIRIFLPPHPFKIFNTIFVRPQKAPPAHLKAMPTAFLPTANYSSRRAYF
jgi:hypothetical protein